MFVKASPRRRRIAGRIAKIEGLNGSDDARLSGLREQLEAARRVDELQAWTEEARATLPAFDQADVEAVGAIAAKLDARVRAGSDGPP